ncbi:MAG: ABC-F type ribosomal protection protein [Peptostreptococcaceae bacterium]|nr:ABC-F type ribosomal protection protein [Peptostreptococcaceae bacterium]
MSQIDVQHLTFAYEGSYDNIFEDKSFRIDTDWRLGLVGRNGKGKTTFLNILRGKYAYQGKITASVEFDYFPFDVPDPDKTAIEVVEAIDPDHEFWKVLREMDLLELSEEVLFRPYSTLSGGERSKLMLSVLFSKEGRFALIDEPTDHLDRHGRELVSRYLRRKKGFVLVSHDRDFLDGCVDHILSIDRNGLEIQKGNFSSWWKNKQQQDALEIEQDRRLRGEIKRLENSAREKSNWSDKVEQSKFGNGPVDRGYIGHLASKMMKRSKSIEKRQHRALEEKSKLLKNIERAHPLKIEQLPYHTDLLCALEDVSISYDGRAVCEKVDLSIRKGDRIALCGKNGSGKSSILKLICGEKIDITGEIKRNDRLKIGYVSQQTDHLHGSLSVYAKSLGIDESLFKAILQKLDLSKTQFEKDMSSFSEGQKKKVLIAASLARPNHLLIWDEPLDHIDVISRIQIEELLLNSEPTILFVEHDSAFCDRIATSIVDLDARSTSGRS